VSGIIAKALFCSSTAICIKMINFDLEFLKGDQNKKCMVTPYLVTGLYKKMAAWVQYKPSSEELGD
jgi:hypothetical protein